MKKYCFIVLIFSFSLPAFSQGVGLLTIDQLNDRVSHGKDTTYVVNFWATWCGSCLHELPNFDQLQRRLKSEKVKVLLASVDFRSQFNTALVRLVKRKKITSEVFMLNETNQQEYINRIDTGWSGAIPATLFIRNNKRRFFEKEFTYAELLKEYHNLQ